MSPAIHFVTQNFPGYGLTDGRFLPCSGVSGRTVSSSPCSSHGPYKTLAYLKTAPLKCTSSRIFIVCNFSSGNKRGFSRNRTNRNDDKGDGFESLDESEDVLPSKNGTISYASHHPIYQPTSNPEHKQKEVLELFKEAQIELRERAAARGKKKKKTTELNQPHGKDDEPVDNVLKILRGNRTKNGKTGSTSSSSGSNRGIILEESEFNSALEKGKSTLDSILDQSEQNGAFERKESSISSDSRNNSKDKAQEHGRKSPTFSRPVSKFQRRSPVRQVKHQSIHSDSVTDTWVNSKSKMLHPDPETNDSGIEMEPEPGFSEGYVFDGMLEEEDSEILEGSADDEVEENKPIIDEDLSRMKLPELRVLAKSRGMKGFSKLKKRELMELLSAGGST